MKFLDYIAKIPLSRLVVTILLGLLVLASIQQMSWVQEVVEHLLNMERISK